MKEETGKKNMESTRLNKKDLINVGIYTALYFVIVLVVAMLGMIPIFMALLAVLVPLAGAIPFVMYLMKIKKAGMLYITSLIMGIMMILTGMGFYTLIIAAVTGLLAELIWRSGHYTSQKRIAPTYAVFSLWCWGNYFPYFFNRDSYMAARSGYGDAYWSSLAAYLPEWMLPVLALICFVCGLIGAKYAEKILKKKLKRAGIH